MYVSRKESEWWVGCTTYILLGIKFCQTKSNSLFFLFFHTSTLENQKKIRQPPHLNPVSFSKIPHLTRYPLQSSKIHPYPYPTLPIPSPFIIIMINLSISISPFPNKNNPPPPKIPPSPSPVHYHLSIRSIPCLFFPRSSVTERERGGGEKKFPFFLGFFFFFPGC